MLRFLFRRSFLFAASLIVSLVLPYAWMNGQWKQALSQKYHQWSAGRTSGPSLDADSALMTVSASDTTGGSYGSAHGWRADAPVSVPVGTPALSTPVLPGVPIGEVMRFDVTPEWVVQRWPRVSNVPNDQGWTGLRVPLVTGTRIGDIAGALTYYFDPQGQVQRVALVGTTGDPTALTTLVTTQFALQNEGGPGTGLYLARWNGRPTSVLRIRQAAVITADSPQNRFELLMEINRPNFGYGLSPTIQHQLAHQLR